VRPKTSTNPGRPPKKIDLEKADPPKKDNLVKESKDVKQKSKSKDRKKSVGSKVNEEDD
jgi:hypothetical protein